MCGTDGRTHAGPCALKRAACVSGALVGIAHRAPCAASTSSIAAAAAAAASASAQPDADNYTDASGAHCT